MRRRVGCCDAKVEVKTRLVGREHSRVWCLASLLGGEWQQNGLGDDQFRFTSNSACSGGLCMCHATFQNKRLWNVVPIESSRRSTHSNHNLDLSSIHATTNLTYNRSKQTL